jgi:hypothetical protein
MSKLGIICDLSYKRSIALSTYYYALRNLYGDLVLIQKPEDLNDIKAVFICNEHHLYHRPTMFQSWFMDICNQNRIKLIVLSGETIKNNVQYAADVEAIQSYVERFNNLHQYVWDVNDSILMNKHRINYGVSRYYKGSISPISKKLNKCIFIGQTPPHYRKRIDLLNVISRYMDIDVFTNGVGESWEDYMNIISKYRFILSPISGASNGIPMRYYEGLLAGCIPIQQVVENTLSSYEPEAKLPDAIYFQEAEELPEKIAACTLDRATSELWLEDSIRQAFVADKLHEVLGNI